VCSVSAVASRLLHGAPVACCHVHHRLVLSMCSPSCSMLGNLIACLCVQAPPAQYLVEERARRSHICQLNILADGKLHCHSSSFSPSQRLHTCLLLGGHNAALECACVAAKVLHNFYVDAVPSICKDASSIVNGSKCVRLNVVRVVHSFANQVHRGAFLDRQIYLHTCHC
jgi:hypothetical protein